MLRPPADAARLLSKEFLGEAFSDACHRNNSNGSEDVQTAGVERNRGDDDKEGKMGMSSLPERVSQAWKNREGPAILTTVDANRVPNSIYVTCVGMQGDDRMVVADNYFNKTRQNVKLGGIAALLFIDKTGKAYQIKGTMEYHTEGAVFDGMKCWNPKKHPGHAALAIRVEQIFSGSEKLL